MEYTFSCDFACKILCPDWQNTGLWLRALSFVEWLSWGITARLSLLAEAKMIKVVYSVPFSRWLEVVSTSPFWSLGVQASYSIQVPSHAGWAETRCCPFTFVAMATWAGEGGGQKNSLINFENRFATKVEKNKFLTFVFLLSLQNKNKKAATVLWK